MVVADIPFILAVNLNECGGEIVKIGSGGHIDITVGIKFGGKLRKGQTLLGVGEIDLD